MQAQAGSGVLEFTLVRDCTVVERALARSPLRLLQPKNHGSAAWVYTSNYGGGLVEPDCLDLRVHVGPGARAVLLSQASTKVYRGAAAQAGSPGKALERACSQRLNAAVGPNGLLVVAPDALSCFAGSRYHQEQHIKLAPTASLALCDWLTAGRCLSDERWAGHRYRSRLVIERGGDPILRDALLLDPTHGALAGRMGRFESLGMLVLIGPLLEAAAAVLLDEVNGTPLSRCADLLLAAGPLPGGALLRLAATSAERMGAALRHHLRLISPLLGDDPWARKF